MSVALGLLGLALLGADGLPPSAAPSIRYQVRLLEMEGLDWRQSVYTRLQPVTRQGSVSVWTASRTLRKPLADRAARVVLSPRVMALPDAPAHFSFTATRKVASQLTRHADGPIDHAMAVAYTPDVEEIREGCQFTVSGRKLDQGILTRLVVDEARVAAVHQVKLAEMVVGGDRSSGETKITPQLDVPEIVKASAEGVWLIPDDGLLVLSMGAHTMANDQGKAVVRERVMLIEADQATASSLPIQASATAVLDPQLKGQAPSTVPMPSLPSRSLPQGRIADGTPVPLPPLPEGREAPSSLPGSSEPCASPQMPVRPVETPLDIESTRASFQAECCAPSGPATPVDKAAKGSIPPYLLRLPLSSGLTIEIRASVVPSTSR